MQVDTRQRALAIDGSDRMFGETDIDLLLVGKTGTGKSATANMILGRDAFEAISSTDSVTTIVRSEVTEYKGKVIKVVDGPGVGDTRIDSDEALQLVTSEMERAILMNSKGYHAFLLVIRYGGRFGNEDQDIIKFLKDVFGPTFVRDFCILVMTCGDSYEREQKRTGVPFDQWCRQQKGSFWELLDECAGRIVLFDNHADDDGAKREAQIDKLLHMVRSLQMDNHRYRNESFEKAGRLKQEGFRRAGLPSCYEEILQEISLIDEILKRQKKRLSAGREIRMAVVLTLPGQCDRLMHKLQNEKAALPNEAIIQLVSRLSRLKVALEKFIKNQDPEEFVKAHGEFHKGYQDAKRFDSVDFVVKALGWTNFAMLHIIAPAPMASFWLIKYAASAFMSWYRGDGTKSKNNK